MPHAVAHGNRYDFCMAFTLGKTICAISAGVCRLEQRINRIVVYLVRILVGHIRTTTYRSNNQGTIVVNNPSDTINSNRSVTHSYSRGEAVTIRVRSREAARQRSHVGLSHTRFSDIHTNYAPPSRKRRRRVAKQKWRGIRIQDGLSFATEIKSDIKSIKMLYAIYKIGICKVSISGSTRSRGSRPSRRDKVGSKGTKKISPSDKLPVNFKRGYVFLRVLRIKILQLNA